MKKAAEFRGILLFLLLSFAGAWLISLPLWIDERGLQHSLASLLLPGMMAFPSAATLLVVFVLSPEAKKTRLMGLRLGSRGWWRYWIFGWLVVPLFAILAPFVSTAFGFYALDVQEFSGFQELLMSRSDTADLNATSIQILVLGQLFSILLAPVLNAIFALGEEIGWRGYLLPKLLPLGQWPALLISGTTWGIWHAPIVLLGYNYPQHPDLVVVLMVAFCVIFGILFGWMRLATGGIWPAVIAHGALNGSAGVMYLFSRAGEEFDTAHAGITGWTGWILPIAWILALVATRRLPVPHPPDIELTKAGNKAEQTAPAGAQKPRS
jgi:membrane protease YdiL (CAAX protease family)